MTWKHEKDLIKRLEKFVKETPHKEAFLYLQDSSKLSLTYEQLDQQSNGLAIYLQQQNLSQQPILLIYPTTVDFLPAFFSCLYSRNIAVPIAAPAGSNLNKTLPVIDVVIQDAKIKTVFTTAAVKKVLQQHTDKFASFKKVSIIDTLTIPPAKQFTKQSLQSNDIVYLQYTSGSTANPKGAAISYSALVQSLNETVTRWKYTDKSVSFTWAPHTHVYGLVVGILTPIFSKSLTIASSPQSFILDPLSWLQTISTYKVTHAGCPNFGYEHCVQEINSDEITGLNLSHWTVAVNGGEPVQSHTLVQFANKFASIGFKLEHFYPTYGISEISGLVATKLIGEKTHSYEVDAAGILNNEVLPKKNSENIKTLVSCGKPLNGIDIKIVDPDTQQMIADEKIGEIWMHGEQCFSGYWPDTTQRGDSFATLPGSERRYFRSGDLGFLKKGELFLTGRLKELIIIYGKNYYPLDIEVLARQSHVHFKYPCVAFSLEVKEKEELFIVQEIGDDINFQDLPSLIDAMREYIFANLGIDAYGIILVQKGSLPITTSGKVQRMLSKRLFVENKFTILYKSMM